MDITLENLTILYQSLNARFQKAVAEAKAPEGYAPFVTVLPSSTAIENVPMGAILGDLEEFVDEQHWKNIVRWMQGIHNRPFTNGFAIPKDNVADDQLGFYPQETARLGGLAATHPWRSVPSIIINGLTDNWVDDQAVWSASHNIGGWAFNNLDNQPLTPDGYHIVKEHLRMRLGPEGETMDLQPTDMFVGPANEDAAKMLIHREMINASNNIYLNDVKIHVWGRLTGKHAYDWGIADLSEGQVPPIIVTDREAPTLVGQIDPAAESVINNREFRYVASRRYGMGVLCPWLVQFSRGLDNGPATTEAPTTASA
jgi:phage major head subunit gpT-like protein